MIETVEYKGHRNIYIELLNQKPPVIFIIDSYNLMINGIIGYRLKPIGNYNFPVWTCTEEDIEDVFQPINHMRFLLLDD